MTGFTTLGTSLPWINKRAGEVLDYILDFSAWLGTDTLSSVSVAVDSGITVSGSPAPAINAAPLNVTLSDGTSKTIAAGQAAVVWLSGGAVGNRYQVTISCTSGARTVQRGFEVRVVAG